MDDLLKKHQEWFDTQAREYESCCTPESVWMVKYKVAHTKRVVEWGKKIMEDKLWPKERRSEGLLVCQLHDVGRFAQAKEGSFDEKVVNHAEAGAKMAEESGLFETEVIEAIAKHNDPFYKGENPLVRLVRDADQMAIIEELEAQIATHSQSWLDHKRLSKRVWEKYRKGMVIDNADLVSAADWLVQLASWRDHFNFETTKMWFDKMGYKEDIKTAMKEFNPKINLRKIFDSREVKSK